MKRLIITALVSIAAAGHAMAADLPQPAPPPPQAPAVYVAPVYNWAGVYIGLNGGWGFGKSQWTVGTLTSSPSNNGGVIGGTLGVNFQSGAFVFGAEGDFDWSAINTGTSVTVCQVIGTCQTGNNWLSTFRGRVGFAADRVLFYATAGGAFANVQTTINGVTNSNTQAGWTAGLGVEGAFAENWTAKVEYLYVDLGTFNGTCSTAACTTAGAVLPFSDHVTESIVRAGVNYKFNF